jgi:hypothetical protein
MKINGINDVLKELRKEQKGVERAIDLETEAIAIQVERDAKKLAPKNFGKLAQSISHSKVKTSQYKITVNEEYGVYMEFGTGLKVSVPAEFAEIASQFKGKRTGTFEQGLESIKVWCRAKGIPEENAKWIFLKILGVGLTPRPFLYPSWVKGKKDYLANLTKLLKKK